MLELRGYLTKILGTQFTSKHILRNVTLLPVNSDNTEARVF